MSGVVGACVVRGSGQRQGEVTFKVSGEPSELAFHVLLLRDYRGHGRLDLESQTKSSINRATLDQARQVEGEDALAAWSELEAVVAAIPSDPRPNLKLSTLTTSDEDLQLDFEDAPLERCGLFRQLACEYMGFGVPVNLVVPSATAIQTRELRNSIVRAAAAFHACVLAREPSKPSGEANVITAQTSLRDVIAELSDVFERTGWWLDAELGTVDASTGVTLTRQRISSVIRYLWKLDAFGERSTSPTRIQAALQHWLDELVASDAAPRRPFSHVSTRLVASKGGFELALSAELNARGSPRIEIADYLSPR